jgi:hypothetical protein
VPGTVFEDSFCDGSWDRWVYYGHERYITIRSGRLNLGRRPGSGAVNVYRSGEKALVRHFDWTDCSVRTRLRIRSGRCAAGLLLRIAQPGLGYHAHRGYFVSLLAEESKLVLGFCDGERSHVLIVADCPVTKGKWYKLRADAFGDSIRVYLDDEIMITLRDTRYVGGMAGVRVFDTHAEFDDFEIRSAR